MIDNIENDELTLAGAGLPHAGETPASVEAWCDDELALDQGSDGTPEDEARAEEDGADPGPAADPDLWLYRDRTSAILRRYLRLAIEVGRLPALLGREFFRTRVTSYHTQTFEDTVIFVHDVESCLALLADADVELIGVIVMQEHPHWEVARKLHCTRRTIVRSYGESLDRLSEIFLRREILLRVPEKKRIGAKACQEGKSTPMAASA
jgi:hypothetical protein